MLKKIIIALLSILILSLFAFTKKDNLDEVRVSSIERENYKQETVTTTLPKKSIVYKEDSAAIKRKNITQDSRAVKMQLRIKKIKDIDSYREDEKKWVSSANFIQIPPQGVSIDEYFEGDDYDFDWSRETEESFYKIFSDPYVRGKYPDFTMYNNSCKKTTCKISLTNYKFTEEQFDFFVSQEGTERFRSLVFSKDEEGNQHMYVIRGER